MPSEPAGGEAGAQRHLPRIALAFSLLRSLQRYALPVIAVLFFSRGYGYEGWLVAFLLPSLTIAFFRYFTFTYTLGSEGLVIRTGLFFRQERHIPYARIQNVDLRQNPLHRLADVAVVRLETGSGGAAEAEIEVLTREAIDELRAAIFSGAGGRPAAGERAGASADKKAGEGAGESAGEGVAPAVAPVAATTPLLELGPGDLVLRGLLTGRGYLLLAAAFGLGDQLGIFDIGDEAQILQSLGRDFGRSALAGGPSLRYLLIGLLLIGALLAATRLLSVVWTLMNFWRFRLSRRGEDLTTEQGLLTRVSATLPRHRIQALELRISWLDGLCDRAALLAATAGRGIAEEDRSENPAAENAELLLAPILRRDAAEKLMHQLAPELFADELSWQGLHPGTFARILRRRLLVLVPLAALAGWQLGPLAVLPLLLLAIASAVSARRYVLRSRWALGRHAVFWRTGIWGETLKVVPLEKIQVVVLQSSPFDRRRGTATLRVDSAATDLTQPTLNLPYLDAAAARELAARLENETGRELVPLVGAVSKRCFMVKNPVKNQLQSQLKTAAAMVLLGCLFAAADRAEPAPIENGFLPQGFAVGDVRSDAAIFWTRLPSGHGRLELRDQAGALLRRVELTARAEDDFTTQVELTELRSNQRYGLRLLALDAAGKELEGRDGELRTAPGKNEKSSLSFVMSGDLGGQGYCRHPDQGYAIFQAMSALKPDFFVANGDLIYADSICPPKNPDGAPNLESDYLDVADKNLDWRDAAKTFTAFAGHWRYNRADAHYQDFLAHTALYAQWDDHEVINDFGSPWPEWPLDPGRPGYPELVAQGTRALFLYNPIRRHQDEPRRIYRAFSWGPDLDLVLIDARSYRSPNDYADRPSNAKTALGKKQVAWLKETLRGSTATFKVISNDVPLSLPTGGQTHLYGRDAFANGATGDFSQRTGFESELLDLLTFLDRENIDNVVFLVTDVHFAMQLRYELDLDGDGDLLQFHELVAGPLSAVRTLTPFQLDPTLKPTTLFAKGDLFNFLFVRLEPAKDGTPRLFAEIRDERGQVQEGSRLEIAPRVRGKS